MWRLGTLKYLPRYSYSPTGRMGGSPDVQMPDPLEYLAFVAACTERLVLGTAVVVATLHQPAVLAKRVATLDALSGGRVRLGVGSGWQVEEYAACGVPYEKRGARLDEVIVAMRELWQPGKINDIHARLAGLEHARGIHTARSEERRVGKECGVMCRSRWSPYH